MVDEEQEFDHSAMATDSLETKMMSWLERWRKSPTSVIIVVSLALFTDMVLYDVIVPILPPLLDRVGRDERDVGSLFAIYAVGYLLCTPIFGIWSDSLQNRKIPMLVGQAGLAIATILFTSATSFHILMLARFLQGTAAACSWTLGLALLADTFPPARLGSVMGIVLGFNTLGYFIGPLVGGILTQLVSLQCPFYFCSVLALIDFVGRLLISSSSTYSNSDHLVACISAERADGPSLFQLFCYPEILMFGIIIALSSASFSAVETLLAHYLQTKFKLSIMGVSFIMMAIIGPSVVCSFISGYWADKYCRYAMTVFAMLIYLVAPPLLALAPNIPLFIIAAMYFGSTSAILSTPAMPEMASLVCRLGGASYARVYALSNICYSLGMLGGPIIAVRTNDQYGFLGAMSVFSLAMALYLPAFIWLTRKSRRCTLLPFRYDELSTERQTLSAAPMQMHGSKVSRY